MGYSDLGRAPRSSRHIAAELGRLLQGRGITDSIVAVGASFGGFNMRVFASEYPGAASALVLIDASHEDQAARFAAAGAPEERIWYARALPLAASLGILRIAGMRFENPAASAPALVRSSEALSYQSKIVQGAVAEYLALQESAADVRATRRSLNIPIVVLTAGRSEVLPQLKAVWLELQRDQAQLSVNACHRVDEQSGHIMAAARPESVIAAIRSAVDAVRSGSSRLDCSE
jgi:pimeloyl-ACP methyl ester carboxylesterase